MLFLTYIYIYSVSYTFFHYFLHYKSQNNTPLHEFDKHIHYLIIQLFYTQQITIEAKQYTELKNAFSIVDRVMIVHADHVCMQLRRRVKNIDTNTFVGHISAT